VAVTYLADASALARVGTPEVSEILVPLMERGLIATCGVIDLEILRSARNGLEHARIREDRYALPRLPMLDEVWDRAIAVQGLLADRGQHRSMPIPDLLIAATAERHGAIVLHYDKDYDLIAEVTGQLVEWVVPRGSVP